MMQIVSELRNPLFEPPDRQRALRALDMTRRLKEDNKSKAWAVVRNMIEKVLAEQFDSNITIPKTSPAPFTTLQPGPTNSSTSRNTSTYVDRIPNYALEYSLNSSSRQTPQTSQPVPMQTMQPVEPMQTIPAQFNPQESWDDINFNMIAGDVAPQNQSITEFDWVSAVFIELKRKQVLTKSSGLLGRPSRFQ